MKKIDGDFGSKFIDHGVEVLYKVLYKGLPAIHSTSCGTEAEMLGSLMMLPSGVYSTPTQYRIIAIS